MRVRRQSSNHGDAEWTGKKCMYMQKPARVLTEAQIGFDFVPSDDFSDAVYQTDLTEGLSVYRQKIPAPDHSGVRLYYKRDCSGGGSAWEKWFSVRIS